jgi:hypothetical protein
MKGRILNEQFWTYVFIVTTIVLYLGITVGAWLLTESIILTLFPAALLIFVSIWLFSSSGPSSNGHRRPRRLRRS